MAQKNITMFGKKMVLLEEPGDGNWNYYVSEDREETYYIVNEQGAHDGCVSGWFGSIEYYIHFKYQECRNDIVKLQKLRDSLEAASIDHKKWYWL